MALGSDEFPQRRHGDAHECAEDVQDGQFELLCETGLNREDELFEGQNEEGIVSPRELRMESRPPRCSIEMWTGYEQVHV